MSITLLNMIESVLVGGTSGFLSGFLGIGGGFILVPLLTLIGVPIHTAVGTSLAFIAFAALAGMVQHIRQQSIDLALALALSIPATVAAKVSAHFSSFLSPSWLYLLFSMMVLAVLPLFYFFPLPQRSDTFHGVSTHSRPLYILHRQRVAGDVSYDYEVNLITAMLGGTATGAITGLFGVGGGFLLIPLMVTVLHIPLRVAIGTCLGVIILPSTIGAVTHWQLGHVDVGLWLPLVITGILTSQFGARWAVRTQPELVKRLFLLVILGGALFMLIRGLMALI